MSLFGDLWSADTDFFSSSNLWSLGSANWAESTVPTDSEGLLTDDDVPLWNSSDDPLQADQIYEWWTLTVVTTDVNQDYTVDIAAGTTPQIVIDYSDGTTDTHTTTGQKTHTFASAGTHTVKIRGQFASAGNIRLGSNSGNRARLKTTSAIPYIPGMTSCAATFQNCSGMTDSIPEALFSSNPNIISFSNVFDTSGVTGSIPTDLFRYNTAATDFGFAFQSCTGLTGSIPATLFSANTAATLIRYTFNGCTGLTGSIPADLFRYNVLNTKFTGLFTNCSGLTGEIPADLFKYNTLVNEFSSALRGCTGLTGSIPADLFRYMPLGTSATYLFYGSTGLTGEIPADLFRYNPLITSFYPAFQGCTGLTSIPADLFKYNTAAASSGFRATFYNASNLAGVIPEDLFRYNTQVVTTGFNTTFRGCTKLILSANIFGPPEEYSTRFLNKAVDFGYCFYSTGTAATQGIAPPLWSYDFGTATPVKTDCFQNHSLSTVSNYASIPAAWL